MTDYKLEAIPRLHAKATPFTEWEDIILIDLETNLAHDTIWCCGYASVQSGMLSEGFFVHPHELVALLKERPDAVIGVHNGNSFDFSALKKVWGMDIPSTRQTIDTWVVENLLNPGTPMNYLGLNALAAKYLGEEDKKEEFAKEDFDRGLTQKMADYCIQDCRLSLRVLLAQLKELKARGDNPLALTIEQECNLIIQEQKRKGVLLDERQATILQAQWQDEVDTIKADMIASFPPTLVQLKTKVKSIPFNPGSRPQIISRLMDRGWKPTKFTDHPTNPQPKLDEDTMENLESLGFPEAVALGRYFKIGKMLGFVKKWLSYRDSLGRIHGNVNSNGAATSRMTHDKPNLANIPAHDAELGPLCRSCFVVPKGRKLLGTDGKSLEERMLAHYINNPTYTQKALEDGHSYRRDLLGLEGKEGRNTTKTWFYAFLYGGGDPKLGYILLGYGVKEAVARKAGKESRAKIIDKLPGMKKLVTLIDQYFEQKKAVPLVDGRWIKLRSSHSALNALLQGSGAVVMKVALILANKRLKELGLRDHYDFVLNVHDEFQTEVDEDKVEQVSEVILNSFKEAGELLRLNCPIEGNALVGNNWSETH